MDMTKTLGEQLQEDFDQFPYRIWVHVVISLFKTPDSDTPFRKIYAIIPLPLSKEYSDLFEASGTTYEDCLAAMTAEIVELWDTDILTRLGWQPDLIESLRKKHIMFPTCSVFVQIGKIASDIERP